MIWLAMIVVRLPMCARLARCVEGKGNVSKHSDGVYLNPSSSVDHTVSDPSFVNDNLNAEQNAGQFDAKHNHRLSENHPCRNECKQQVYSAETTAYDYFCLHSSRLVQLCTSLRSASNCHQLTVGSNVLDDRTHRTVISAVTRFHSLHMSIDGDSRSQCRLRSRGQSKKLMTHRLGDWSGRSSDPRR